MTARLRKLAVDLAAGDAVVWPAVVSGIAIGAASYLVGSRRGDVRVDVAMASMAAFLFGVLLAFTIVRTRERLALVQDLVAPGTTPRCFRSINWQPSSATRTVTAYESSSTNI